MSALRHCHIAFITCAESGDTLAAVAVAEQRDLERLLDLVIESAMTAERWPRQHACALVAVRIGESCLAIPAPMTPSTGDLVWSEVRPYFIEDTGARVISLDTERVLRNQLEQSLRAKGIEPNDQFSPPPLKGA